MKRPKPQQTLGLRLVAEKGLDAYEKVSFSYYTHYILRTADQVSLC